MDQYGVLGGYEERLDEADEQGSRAIPSRTSLGCEAAFCEKFPQYGGIRRFFFGLIEERSWGYRCVLTLPQIEIMQSDLPHTLYKKQKDRKKVVVDDEAVRLQEEANKRAAERRAAKNGQQTYTIDELFADAADE